MIFSELYSVYYTAVAGLIKKAQCGKMSEKELRDEVISTAFSESFLTIIPALKSQKWQLTDSELVPVLKHTPTMPLTTLQKRWLKALLSDPRLKLFGVDLPELDGVSPLFTPEDYRIFDQYSDGDPYEDEGYIKRFKTALYAIKNGLPLYIQMKNRHGKRFSVHFYPKSLEYSLKDDKIRIVPSDRCLKFYNLGRLEVCEISHANIPVPAFESKDKIKELCLVITDERNALDRALLHFAHFEKSVKRLDDKRYALSLKYYENDETELVIRVLSFGPFAYVSSPSSFKELIRERLISQKRFDI